jgi:DNA polymerase III delta prime subunit
MLIISDLLRLQELLAAINAAGAAHISFNPLTKANIDKALQQASAESGIQLPGEVVTSIADSASGDLRNGLQTLQLAAAGLPLEEQGTKTSKAKARAKYACNVRLYPKQALSVMSPRHHLCLALGIHCFVAAYTL